MTYSTKSLKDAAGSAFNAGVDIISSVVYNRMKMSFGAEGAITDVSASNPLPVDPGTVTVTVDSTTPVDVRGNTTILKPTITVGASPDYSADDCIGGIITIANAYRATTVGMLLQSIHLWCDDALTPVMDVMFFDTLPAGGTYTDNGALSLSSADKSAWLCTVPIDTSDWKTVLADTWVNKLVGYPLKGNSTASLYILIRAGETINFSGTNVLKLQPGLLRD